MIIYTDLYPRSGSESDKDLHMSESYEALKAALMLAENDLAVIRREYEVASGAAAIAAARASSRRTLMGAGWVPAGECAALAGAVAALASRAARAAHRIAAIEPVVIALVSAREAAIRASRRGA